MRLMVFLGVQNVCTTFPEERQLAGMKHYVIRASTQIEQSLHGNPAVAGAGTGNLDHQNGTPY